MLEEASLMTLIGRPLNSTVTVPHPLHIEATIASLRVVSDDDVSDAPILDDDSVVPRNAAGRVFGFQDPFLVNERSSRGTAMQRSVDQGEVLLDASWARTETQ